MFSRASKARLTRHDLDRFPGNSLFDRVARAVCEAGCLPRKELFEAWEVARRVRRRFRGGRVVDLCAGHGLLGQLMLLLDDSSADARLLDATVPPSAATLHRTVAATWPRLAGRVHFEVADVTTVALEPGDLVVSVHACGPLTDEVIGRALEARARVAVLPCCHDLRRCETGNLDGWMDGPLAVDATRAARLRAAGYDVWTQRIPDDITPHNRLLMAAPV